MDNKIELLKALQKAKRSFKNISTSGRNNHQKYDYSKLVDIYNSVQNALLDNDIIITHYRDSFIEGFEKLHTRLIHTPTGEFLEDVTRISPEKPGSQGMGAAITYAKRYAVLSLCAIAPGDDEDDDGQSEQVYLNEAKSKPKTGEDNDNNIATGKTKPSADLLTLKDKVKNTIDKRADKHKILENIYKKHNKSVEDLDINQLQSLWDYINKIN